MTARRGFLQSTLTLLAAAGLAPAARAQVPAPPEAQPEADAGTEAPAATQRSVVTPDGVPLPWRMKDGVKEFHLVAEPVEHEFAPGCVARCWGYNGRTPGPTLEAVEGDRVRILVTNRLPEHTSIHWHGILLPNGMDGVGGLNQPHIRPGETYAYEFTLRQHGTHMYHPHADEMVQIALGMMGLFVIHPRVPREPPVDRDYAIMLHAWGLHPGTARPDPSVMTEFDLWSFNGRVFPGTSPLLARTGERVRLRIANLSMHDHPIHLHGVKFQVTARDGGQVPPAARVDEVTVNVPVGTTRDLEFLAELPGDWALHCHKSHHTMNAMGHGVPNMLGVDQDEVAARMRTLLPGYMAMGKTGMAEHGSHLAMGHLRGPRNTLPMMAGKGPFGPLEMGGMFTVLKVRDSLDGEADPGWYRHPPGTVARRV